MAEEGGEGGGREEGEGGEGGREEEIGRKLHTHRNGGFTQH